MGGHIPMRMCVACRKMREQDTMLRFVKDKQGGIVSADFSKKLFGRGAYICKSADCVMLAAKKKALQRHFGCAIDNELYKLAEDSCGE